MEGLAETLSDLPAADLLATRGDLPNERRSEIVAGLDFLRGPPTITAIKAYYQEKKDALNKQLQDLAEEEEKVLQYAVEFWNSVRREEEARSQDPRGDGRRHCLRTRRATHRPQ